MLLTAADRKRIALLADQGGPRYPTVPIYAFKGRHALELHSKLVQLREGWDQGITESEKNKSFLVAAIQTTVTTSTTTSDNPYPNPRKRILLDFYCGKTMVPSKTSYSSGKSWLRWMGQEPNNLLNPDGL
jgi:hypothetical protein